MTDQKDYEVILKAMQKATPMKPNVYGDGYADGQMVYDMWECPTCGASYEIEYDEYDYCPKCGQHIDWGNKRNGSFSGCITRGNK